jgi:aspartyl-tRNA(Asn)/glutamyl-tRNA(Gln) amidotransferase subunit C
MSKITKGEVEKIAELSKIHLTDKEKEKYSKELSSVLGYVEKLQKIKTDNIEETSQVTGLTNIYREDKVSDIWKANKDVRKNRIEMLKNAKEKKGDYVKVKQMLG